MILLVETPGTEPVAWRPLVAALESAGEEVRVVAFPCSGDSESFAAAIERAEPAGEYTLVAHGVGATLALQAELRPARAILLGPVLGVEPSAALARVASRPLGPEVRLDHPREDAAILGVTGVPLRCVARGFAEDVQAWIATGDVPRRPIDAPVTVLAAPLDEIAPIELLVPAARALGALDRPVRLIRLGLGDLASRDLDHAGLLTDPDALARLARLVADAP